MTFEEAKRIFAALVANEVDFVVIGSMAMAAHGLPRATQDLDLFVAPSWENIEALKEALTSLYDDPAIDEIEAGELLGDYPAVQYVPPHGEYSLDILTRLGEAFAWEDVEAGAEELLVENLKIRVVSVRTLYEMKKDTMRPQDRADAFRLRQTFDLEDD